MAVDVRAASAVHMKYFIGTIFTLKHIISSLLVC